MESIHAEGSLFFLLFFRVLIQSFSSGQARPLKTLALHLTLSSMAFPHDLTRPPLTTHSRHRTRSLPLGLIICRRLLVSLVRLLTWQRVIHHSRLHPFLQRRLSLIINIKLLNPLHYRSRHLFLFSLILFSHRYLLLRCLIFLLLLNKCKYLCLLPCLHSFDRSRQSRSVLPTSCHLLVQPTWIAMKEEEKEESSIRSQLLL